MTECAQGCSKKLAVRPLLVEALGFLFARWMPKFGFEALILHLTNTSRDYHEVCNPFLLSLLPGLNSCNYPLVEAPSAPASAWMICGHHGNQTA